ncbi:MAG: hypothetical protein LBM96_00810 [Methanobrevibacter sp.]|nr:hypothetical protein [Candidatus Methanoflexus mossambicus]
MANGNEFDKFYTKPEIAKMCIDFTFKYLEDWKDNLFLEPCAGNGSFSKQLPNCDAFDIKPEDDSIKKMDFYEFNNDFKDYVCITNPPFGKRSVEAINFFNKATKFSKMIGFLVPVSFMKWSVQKQLNKKWKLVDWLYLPENGFTSFDEDYSIRTVFQIWKKDGNIDFRLKKSPPISHPDLKIWQYNATHGAEKYFDEDWEIAVYRQGYKDYSTIFTKNDLDWLKENKQIQFFFIKPLNKRAREIISKIDFNQLADRNTTVKGFGKADFISMYLENLNKFDKKIINSK